MKNCKDIENNLPLYLDDSLSGAGKRTVEEHLKSCPQCAKALAELEKTATLVNNLGQVDPPPWFKQKIMASVREEAAKKSLVPKWFYPLRIKIPVQIMATIVIAVLAVYIYRWGDEKINAVLPPLAPAPIAEVQKNQLPKQRMKTSVDEAIKQEDQIIQEEDAIQKKEVSRNIARDTSAGATKGAYKQVVPDIKTDKYENAPAAKSVILPEPKLEMKKDIDSLGAAMKESRVLKTRSVKLKTVVYLRVTDISAAMEEAEKLLVKHEAKNIVRETMQGKATLNAEIKNQKIKDLIASLKTIGYVEEGSMPDAVAEGNIPVMIEILNN